MVLDGAGAGNDKQDREHHKHNYKSVHPQRHNSEGRRHLILLRGLSGLVRVHLKAFTPEGLYKIVKRKTNFLTAKLQLETYDRRHQRKRWTGGGGPRPRKIERPKEREPPSP